MNMKRPSLLVTTSPFVTAGEDTASIMWQVNYALMPAVLAATWYFGISALLIVAACVAGTVLPEWLAHRKERAGATTLRDGSALLTGILLALTLPPGIPLWMAFVGGVISIVLGKLIFGGIGFNVFNPALVGRAFLQAAFPGALTTWVPHSYSGGFWTLPGNTLTIPFLKPGVNAVTAATPLAQMKFESTLTGFADLLLGSTAGALGETSAVALLLGGLYLGMRNIVGWRIPGSIFATVFIFASVLHWVNPVKYPPGWFHLFAGGMVLGAVFMATDMVTSPLTKKGCLLFGFGIGFIAIVIRVFGGLPEGVMYSILLMNAMVPLINKATQPRVYGTQKRKKMSTGS